MLFIAAVGLQLHRAFGTVSGVNRLNNQLGVDFGALVNNLGHAGWGNAI